MLDGVTPPGIIAAALVLLLAWRWRSARGSKSRARRFDARAALVLVALTALIEHQMGRPWTYRRGPVRLWSGNINGDQNSQQVADPYTFTHVTHGALFYALTAVTLPSASVGLRLLTAVGFESAWESYENTRTVIERYRAATVSIGYYGDSVLNSVCDILACMLGFWITSRLPRKVTIAGVVVLEVLLAFWIRDNLTLNLLMLIHPVNAVRTWQAGV